MLELLFIVRDTDTSYVYYRGQEEPLQVPTSIIDWAEMAATTTIMIPETFKACEGVMKNV